MDDKRLDLRQVTVVLTAPAAVLEYLQELAADEIEFWIDKTPNNEAFSDEERKTMLKGYKRVVGQLEDQLPKTRRVVIEVTNGTAKVALCPKDIKVEIVNRDNAEDLVLVRVEYDLDYHGGNYDGAGDSVTVLVPSDDEKYVKDAFERLSPHGATWDNVIQYALAEEDDSLVENEGIACCVCGCQDVDVVQVSCMEHKYPHKGRWPLGVDGFVWDEKGTHRDGGSTDEEVAECTRCHHRGPLADFNFPPRQE